MAMLFPMACCIAGCAPSSPERVLGGDPRAGAIAITRHACGSCHLIPGVQDADGRVGPSLGEFGSRRMIAGWVPNTPEALRAYLLDPQGLVPGNVMPNQGLTDRQARDIAAFLEGQR